MNTYEFSGVKKTLKKNTFEIEETVKDAIGANEKNEKRLIALYSEMEKLQKEFATKPIRKRKDEINKRVSEIESETSLLISNIKWYDKFEMVLKVMDVLLVEGSTGLTKKNFGRFDAQGVWNDFFTAPQANNED